MTVYLKRNPDGTFSPYRPESIWTNPEFVKSLKKARTDLNEPHAYVGYDIQGRQWINGRKGAPTWAEIVEGYMVWPVQEVLHHHGKSVTYGPLVYWTRAEAEAKAAKLYPDLKP